jgi:hypothetical protein
MQQMFQKMDEKRKNKEQFSLGTPQGRQLFSNNDTSNDMNREKVHAGPVIAHLFLLLNGPPPCHRR